jgi:hypothetical protein
MAVVIGWLTMPMAAAAAPPEAAPVHAYAYDAPAHSASTTEDVSERGPPATYDHALAYNAADNGSRGASARSRDATAPATYAYDDTAQSARTARGRRGAMGANGGGTAPRGVAQGLQVAAKTLAGLSRSERAIAGSARAIYGSEELGAIRAAHAAGRSAEVTVGGTKIVYEPGLNASGMTLFGENGFVIGRGAFASDMELAKTIAHESYRLATSQSAGGVGAGLAKAETNAAFSFAEQVGRYVMGGP